MMSVHAAAMRSSIPLFLCQVRYILFTEFHYIRATLIQSVVFH
jgi:hypothetical protein